MKASEIVETAMGLISLKGWVRGHLKTDKGYCVLGAMKEANGGRDRSSIMAFLMNPGPYGLAWEALREAGITGSPAVWNDSVAADKNHVLEVMDRAAHDLRERGL